MLWAPVLLQGVSFAWAASKGSHWTYEGAHGQERWQETYPDCGWQAQSPINIQTESVQYEPSLPPVEPEGYRSPGTEKLTLKNNGHTVQLSLPQTMRLHGLPRVYSAVQLHFHWGSQRHTGGSEHQVDGRAFPAEVHIVHFNSEKYANLSEAKNQADGLAVLGIFLEVGDSENPAYSHILDHLKDIRHAEQEISLSPFNIRDLLPAHLGHYFRYNGSLTTPPCYQSVLWTVFHLPAHISAAQLAKLQKSLHSTKEEETLQLSLVDNFRRPQDLNHRPVLSSFPAAPSGYSAGKIVAIIFGVFLGCLSLFLAGWIAAKRIREKTRQDQKGVVFKSSSPRPVTD
ncbi:PREDICTED: carbonic anhydrase 14 isoform X1 [Gekko japonicus]|uniref:Carbonic anhydrase n=2 Tax=Gekko japonicus TaxID=146911 RepID=A0ABM1JVV4_GEKJA|nr:PREDICTED: carbonic anhydrase 14 isoform X1 [Gekko japonicus]